MTPFFIEITVKSSNRKRCINLNHVTDVAPDREGHAIICLAVEQENVSQFGPQGEPVFGQRVYVCLETYEDLVARFGVRG